MTLGRVLGLDPGERRIGVALSDAIGIIAQPHVVLDRRAVDAVAEIKALCEEYEIEIAADGSAVYDDSPGDPEFQQDFGIGAGCSAPSGTAVPPVRMRELVDTVSGPGHQHSICSESFAPALSSMAAGILARLPS